VQLAVMLAVVVTFLNPLTMLVPIVIVLAFVVPVAVPLPYGHARA
jgi:hypothetical protein